MIMRRSFLKGSLALLLFPVRAVASTLAPKICATDKLSKDSFETTEWVYSPEEVRGVMNNLFQNLHCFHWGHWLADVRCSQFFQKPWIWNKTTEQWDIGEKEEPDGFIITYTWKKVDFSMFQKFPGKVFWCYRPLYETVNNPRFKGMLKEVVHGKENEEINRRKLRKISPEVEGTGTTSGDDEGGGG